MKEDEIYEIETKLNCKSNSTLISNKKLLGSHKQKFGGNLIRTKAVTKFKTSLIKVY